jgi:amino acid permease
MTTVGGLISWAAICATYLRFRRAYMVQQINVVQAAKSPLQPVLAWYGLVWTTFLSNNFILNIADLKLFFKDI